MYYKKKLSKACVQQHNNYCLMALRLGQSRWVGTRTLRNVNGIYHPQCPQLFTSISTFPSEPPSLPL